MYIVYNSAPINLVVVAFVRCAVVVVIRILCTFQEINKRKKKQNAAQRPGKFAQNESWESELRAQHVIVSGSGASESKRAGESERSLRFVDILPRRMLATSPACVCCLPLSPATSPWFSIFSKRTRMTGKEKTQIAQYIYIIAKHS